MNVRRTGRAAAALLAVLAPLLSGCGDPVLWARFRAERGMWAVHRDIERITIQPQLASAGDYARAERACRRLLAEFPAATWAAPGRLEQPRARDVAREAGRAALALGRIAELRNAPDSALAIYDRTLADWGGVPAVALDAAVARARVLEGAGRSEAAVEAWERVARSFDPVSASGQVVGEVLEAPRRAAALARELGAAGRAHVVLEAGVAKLERWLAEERVPRRAAAGWEAVAEALGADGRAAEAAVAWRHALAAEPDGQDAARFRLEMADAAIAAGTPDSAFVFVDTLITAPRIETRLEARLVRGRAFAAEGHVDSAIAQWDAVADDYPNAIEQAARARWLRGRTLEAAGRWEEARTEYRALTAAYPTHRLGIQAMGRIVEYHAAHGQSDMAEMEGRRAVDALDRLILRQRDIDVQFEAREMRARLLALIGPPGEAVDALTAFWRRYPRSPEGQAAGLRAAGLADSVLHDRERAVDLLREMDGRSIRTAARRVVRARRACRLQL